MAETSGGTQGPILRIPSWLWGRDILGFGKRAGLRMRPVDATTGRWTAQTEERYERRRAGLVSVRKLADRSTSDMQRAFSVIDRLPPTPSTSLTPEVVHAELERILRHGADSLVSLASVARIATATAPNDAAALTVRQVFDSFLTLTIAETGEVAAPDAAAYLVTLSEAIAGRYALVRLLLRLEHAPHEFEAPPADEEPGAVFASAREMFNDTALGLSAYLSPLLLALSPHVWGVPAERVGGVVLFSLGRPVHGRRGEPAELLQLFLPRGGIGGSQLQQDVSPKVIETAVNWWCEQLDRLFAVLTDFDNYRDADGNYQLTRHFEVLLSVEQTFRNVQSLLANERDHNVRKLMLFAALDNLAGVRSPNFDDLCQLRHAERALAKAEELVPDAARPLLLPGARAGVHGLRNLQDGFFLTPRVDKKGVLLPEPDGTERRHTIEAATAQYLRVLRNANHGFSVTDRDQLRHQALLAAHDGRFPENLPLLSYTYLLRLLATVDDLRKEIRGRSRSPNVAPRGGA